MSPRRSPWVKICGVTCVEDAEVAALAGADALGLNFVPGTKRFIDRETGVRIATAMRGRVELVGVFAEERVEALEDARAALSLDWLQLHGDPPPELFERLPSVFRAVGVRSSADLERALAFPGERVLLDAKIDGALGGTGVAFDWSLLEGRDLSRAIVAGGLNPDNVGVLVARVSPFGVDVASGVERAGEPRRKDADKVRAFVERARQRP